MKYENIKNFSQRCEEHPDHQNGMISHQMLLDRAHEEIDELREFIEQAQKQEPMAWYDSKSGWVDFHSFKPVRKPSAPDAEWLPLYTYPPPRQWVGLTEEEYKKIRYGSDESDEPYVSYALYDFNEDGIDVEIHVDNFAKAIETKLRDKNT